MRNIQKSLLTEWLLFCGVIGPILFWMVLLIESITRPNFNMWQTQGSYLALTNQGWEQISNFLVFGILSLFYAAGILRTFAGGRSRIWGPLLAGLFGLGMVCLGIFVTDPGDGYPAGTPLKTDPTTWHGVTHGLIGLVTINVVLIAMCFVFSYRFLGDPKYRRWGTYAWFTAALIIIISIPTTIGLPFAYNAGFPVINGLVQRTIITLGWTWMALTAWKLWQEARRPQSAEEGSLQEAGV